jgi:hypothetical protein
LSHRSPTRFTTGYNTPTRPRNTWSLEFLSDIAGMLSWAEDSLALFLYWQSSVVEPLSRMWRRIRGNHPGRQADPRRVLASLAVLFPLIQQNIDMDQAARGFNSTFRFYASTTDIQSFHIFQKFIRGPSRSRASSGQITSRKYPQLLHTLDTGKGGRRTWGLSRRIEIAWGIQCMRALRGGVALG